MWSGGKNNKKRPSSGTHNPLPLKRHLSSHTAITERRVLLKAISVQEKEDQRTEIPFFEEPLVNSHTLQDYILDRPLGRGSEGSVFLAHDITTAKSVAVKIIEKFQNKAHKAVRHAPKLQRRDKSFQHKDWSPRYKLRRESGRKATEDPRYRFETNDVNLNIKRAKTECYVMSRLDHRHIVSLLHAWEDPHRIILIMDYATGGDLFEHIQERGRPSKRETWRIFKQLLSAVQHMHSRGFIHRDLKPENVFLTEDGNVLLGDFGFSTHWNSLVRKKEEHVVGSMPYVAPEVLLGQLYTGPEIDIWSLGVILYEILSGGLPFDGETPRKMFKAITTEQPQRRPEFSELEFDLLSRMLTKDSVKRATMMDIFQHPWLQTKPQKRRYIPYIPTRLGSFESSSEEEEEEGLEKEMGGRRSYGLSSSDDEDLSYHRLLSAHKQNKWKKCPLSTIVEDSEIKEY